MTQDQFQFSEYQPENLNQQLNKSMKPQTNSTSDHMNSHPTLSSSHLSTNPEARMKGQMSKHGTHIARNNLSLHNTFNNFGIHNVNNSTPTSYAIPLSNAINADENSSMNRANVPTNYNSYGSSNAPSTNHTLYNEHKKNSERSLGGLNLNLGMDFFKECGDITNNKILSRSSLSHSNRQIPSQTDGSSEILTPQVTPYADKAIMKSNLLGTNNHEVESIVPKETDLQYESGSNSDISSESFDTNEDISKKRRRKRKLQRVEFERVMHLTQKDAARELDICLSSFKRQLRSLRPKLKWPRKSGYKQKVIVSKHDLDLQSRLSNLIETAEQLYIEKVQDLDSHNAPGNQSIIDLVSPHWNTEYVQTHDMTQSIRRLKGEVGYLYMNQGLHPFNNIPAIGYRGDINSFSGPWSNLYHEQDIVALTLADKGSNLLASNSLFQQFTGYTNLDFMNGFNLSQLHLPANYRELMIKYIEKLHDMHHINLVEFTSVLEHKSGVLLVFHIKIHFLPNIGMHWGEYRLSNKFMSKVVFKNSITRKESKDATVEKPVSACTVSEMIYDDIQTKNAFFRGTEKIEMYPHLKA